MNLREASAIARRHIADLFASDAPHDIRLENFLYDDHLMVWSLTVGFEPKHGQHGRLCKLVCVSSANNAVLFVGDAP